MLACNLLKLAMISYNTEGKVWKNRCGCKHFDICDMLKCTFDIFYCIILQDHRIKEIIQSIWSYLNCFKKVFPTEYHKKEKNSIKGKSHNSEYLRIL